MNNLRFSKSFSWKCILRLRISVGSLMLDINSVLTVTWDEEAELSKGGWFDLVWFFALQLATYFITAFMGTLVFCYTLVLLLLYKFLGSQNIILHNMEEKIEKYDANVAISFWSWFLSERRLKTRTNHNVARK